MILHTCFTGSDYEVPSNRTYIVKPVKQSYQNFFQMQIELQVNENSGLNYYSCTRTKLEYSLITHITHNPRWVYYSVYQQHF